MSMEELKRSCPLVEVDVLSDGKGGDILVGVWRGAVQVRVACKSVTKDSVKRFQNAYSKAVQIGVIWDDAAPAASPQPAVPAANVVSIDKAGSNAKPVDEVPVEDEPV